MVTIHPYFKIHPGKVDTVKASLPAFVNQTTPESKNLFYAFTLDGDELFCREGYMDGDAVLTHLANVQVLLDELLKNSDLIRLEIHGPSAELEKLKEPLAELKPKWFVHQCGVER